MLKTSFENWAPRCAFFAAQYLIQGVVLGLVAEGMTAELKIAGIGSADIGALMSAFYLTLAAKILFGPAVDRLWTTPFSARRRYLIATNAMLGAALCLAAYVTRSPSYGALLTMLLLIGLLTSLLDILTDATALAHVPFGERGRVSGWMFAGMTAGIVLGGSGSLVLAQRLGLPSAFLAAAAIVLVATALTVAPLHMPGTPTAAPTWASERVHEAPAAVAASRQLGNYVRTFMSLLLSSRLRWAMLFAFLPPGAMALSMPLQTSLGLDVGLSEDQLAELNLWSGLLAIPASLLGGWWADRAGAAKSFAWSVVASTAPVLLLAMALRLMGWPGLEKPPGIAGSWLVATYWIACVVTSLANAVMVSARSAVCLDIAGVDRRQAATHFTALMALSNLANSTAAAWQGYAMAKVGYAWTLAADCGLGMLVLLVLAHPILRKTAPTPSALMQRQPS